MGGINDEFTSSNVNETHHICRIYRLSIAQKIANRRLSQNGASNRLHLWLAIAYRAVEHYLKVLQLELLGNAYSELFLNNTVPDPTRDSLQEALLRD